jgi:hypothetical protein
LLVLSIALPCEQTEAQPQDPLQVTLDFLKTKLETYMTYSLSEGQGPEVGNSKFEAVGFEGCRIAWKGSSEVGQHTDIPQPLRSVRLEVHTSVELSSIDPDKIRIYTIQEMVKRHLPRALVLELKIRSASPGFKQQLETTAGGRITRQALEVKSYSFFFNTNDQSIAEEVSKAFADASNICRSRMKRKAAED